MIQSQCISVTDLRTNTKQCLSEINKEAKYIFVNNKPVAVLLKVEDYESLVYKSELTELNKNEITKQLEKEAKSARKLHKSELINI